MDQATQRLLKKTITDQVSYCLRTGQDLDLAEICQAVRNRDRRFDEVGELRHTYRRAAEEALRRKSHS